MKFFLVPSVLKNNKINEFNDKGTYTCVFILQSFHCYRLYRIVYIYKFIIIIKRFYE